MWIEKMTMTEKKMQMKKIERMENSEWERTEKTNKIEKRKNREMGEGDGSEKKWKKIMKINWRKFGWLIRKHRDERFDRTTKVNRIAFLMKIE